MQPYSKYKRRVLGIGKQREDHYLIILTTR